jgi:hypothetical protein
MISILVVEKSGNIKEQNIKEFKCSELYKKAALKNGDGFELQHMWVGNVQNQDFQIEIYGKTKGRAGQENKYDFPPPVDSTLYFGSCVLVAKTAEGEITDLTENRWNAIYEHLFGGFEDIGSEDSEEEEEEDEDDLLPKTKEGYVKDDFVVDDDDDEDYEDEDEEEEEEIVVKKTKSIRKKEPKSKKISPLPETVFQTETYLDCTSELSEESYV